jgi:probable addiction module antidote protein
MKTKLRKDKSQKKPTESYQSWLIESLKDKKEAAMYLQVALDEYQQDGNVEVLLLALRNVAQAQGGIGSLSKRTNLNRESLYKTLSVKGNPKLQTLGLLLKGLGFHLSIKAVV